MVGSADIPSSIDRVEGYTTTLRDALEAIQRGLFCKCRRGPPRSLMVAALLAALRAVRSRAATVRERGAVVKLQMAAISRPGPVRLWLTVRVWANEKADAPALFAIGVLT